MPYLRNRFTGKTVFVPEDVPGGMPAGPGDPRYPSEAPQPAVGPFNPRAVKTAGQATLEFTQFPHTMRLLNRDYLTALTPRFDTFGSNVGARFLPGGAPIPTANGSTAFAFAPDDSVSADDWWGQFPGDRNAALMNGMPGPLDVPIRGRGAFDQVANLRAEYDAMPGAKEYRLALPQFLQGLKTATTPQGDLALIHAYARVMDPGSVLGPGEIDAPANKDTMAGRITEMLKKEFDGTGSLSPWRRENLRAQMFGKMMELNQVYNAERARYANSAQAFGIDPVRVVGRHDGEPFLPEIQYYMENHRSRNGYTPWQQDTLTSAPLGLAHGGDDKKSVPIPSAMQQKNLDYYYNHQGRLDPDGYAEFRATLDHEFNFGENSPEQRAKNRKWAIYANDQVARGGNVNPLIGPATAAMTPLDRFNAYAFNNPLGAELMAAPVFASGLDEVAGLIRSVAKGTSYEDERDQANMIRQRLAADHPVATLAGSLMGKALAAYAAPLLPASMTTPGALAAAGAIDGALENNDNRLRGAAWGTVTGLGTGLVASPIIRTAAKDIKGSTLEDEIARYRSQGFTQEGAEYLASPYTGRGHHYIRQAGVKLPKILGGIKIKLPKKISDSPLNVLKPKGISTGRFYEEHFKVDPSYFASKLPARVGGQIWNGEDLLLVKHGKLGRLWHGAPPPLKATVGGAGAVGAGGVDWYLTDRK